MNDELKSAVDLAMERLESEAGGEIVSLSDQQKEEIARVRARYKAKTAEQEIAAQSTIRKAQNSGDRAAAEEAKRRLLEEKQRLQAEEEREVEKIRKES